MVFSNKYTNLPAALLSISATLLLCPAVQAETTSDTAASQAPATTTEALPEIRLSPKVRVLSRDKSYFEGLSCEQALIMKLSDLDPQNPQAPYYLKSRKQACIEAMSIHFDGH